MGRRRGPEWSECVGNDAATGRPLRHSGGGRVTGFSASLRTSDHRLGFAAVVVTATNLRWKRSSSIWSSMLAARSERAVYTPGAWFSSSR